MIKKTYINSQIDANLSRIKLKYHEKKTVKLISKKLKSSKNFLDIGCANGSFLFNVSSLNNKVEYSGFDISKKLINLANKKNTNKNIIFKTVNIDDYKTKKKFDIINASGILSNYEDFRIPLKNWLSFKDKEGLLIIFGCFNSRNIDTIIKIRNNYNKSNWQYGLNQYSIKTIGHFLEKKGYNYKFVKFELPINIKESKDPIRSYTVKINQKKRIILTGANIVKELFHLIISN